MKLNLNRECLIRENPRGVKAFDAHYAELGLSALEYRTSMKQPDGRLKMSLWQMCHIYGGEMFMGPLEPIETEIEIVD